MLALILLLFLLRGWLFRSTVHYSKIGERKVIELKDQKLLDAINSVEKECILSVNQILDITDKITRDHLQFSLGKAASDPNLLANTGKANCVGYAALFCSIANYMFKAEDLGHVNSKHLIGQLDFMGMDLHQFFDSPFFRDHDFVEIDFLDDKRNIYIDPSVSDYLWIDRVAVNE